MWLKHCSARNLDAKEMKYNKVDWLNNWNVK